MDLFAYDYNFDIPFAIPTPPQPLTLDPAIGDVMISPASEAPSSSTEGPISLESEVEQRSTRKRKRGNKNAPVGYPAGLKELIARGLIIWGQRITGITSFDPASDVGREPHYSVIHLATLETRSVLQKQAFSGRDEEVEEWALQIIQSLVSSPSPAYPPIAAPPTTTRDVQIHPSSSFSAIDPNLDDNYWHNLLLGSNYGRTPYQPQSSPFPSEAGSMVSSAVCYTDDGTVPPSSRGSTSSAHGTPFFSPPPSAPPEAEPTAHPGVGTYYPDYPYPPSPSYNIFVAPRMSSTPPSFPYWPCGPVGAQAPLQQPSYFGAEAPFAPAAGPSTSYFASSHDTYYGNLN